MGIAKNTFENNFLSGSIKVTSRYRRSMLGNSVFMPEIRNVKCRHPQKPSTQSVLVIASWIVLGLVCERHFCILLQIKGIHVRHFSITSLLPSSLHILHSVQIKFQKKIILSNMYARKCNQIFDSNFWRVARSHFWKLWTLAYFIWGRSRRNFYSRVSMNKSRIFWKTFLRADSSGVWRGILCICSQSNSLVQFESNFDSIFTNEPSFSTLKM